MSREGKIVISRAIIVLVFAAGILALAFGHFLVTLLTVSSGLIIWLLHLLAADLGPRPGTGDTEPTIGQALTRAVAGLGLVLAISAIKTYGMQQTIHGGYTLHMEGFALATTVLLVTLLPLIVLQLGSRTVERRGDPLEQPPVTPQAQLPTAPTEGTPQIPPAPTPGVPEAQQPAYFTPYPQGWYPPAPEPTWFNEHEDYPEDEEWETEDWEEEPEESLEDEEYDEEEDEGEDVEYDDEEGEEEEP